MKLHKIFILAVFVAASVAFINAKPAIKKITPGKGFAVIELFTSEGCSSCPPADELVAKIQKEYKDHPVYILAMHVDYWNRLGWKDVFSSAEYTKRQQTYAQYLRLAEVYTPQIVVNGRKEFVGSEENTLRNAIKTGLQNTSVSQLTLSYIKIAQNKATVHYLADGIGTNNVLLLALVEKSAQTLVKAGENKGRTLSHVQIVQKLQSVSLSKDKSGTESIALPAGFSAKNWEVIGVLQNTTTGEITGATKVEFTAGV